MRAVDGTSYTWTTTTTTSPFMLNGGLYWGDVVLAGGGSVSLTRLGADSVTYLAIAGANGVKSTTFSVQLGRGLYRFESASAGTTYAEIIRIPSD